MAKAMNAGGAAARAIRGAYGRVYEGVNYRLRTFAGGRWASHVRPTSAALLLTERCNARCLHCDIWRNRGQEDSPTIGEWKRLLSDLRAWLGPVPVTMTGGEALLRLYTVELIEHGVSTGLLIEVLTHGYWKDQSRVEAMACAGPWRVTVSLDGLGETHSKIRGRVGFFETTETTLCTLQRVRVQKGLGFTIRLKTVLMDHNLDDVCRLAEYAQRGGMEIMYQPIEQNYNTTEDPTWFERSANWPRDVDKAVGAVQRLIELKRAGLPIVNSEPQLEVMARYFRDPAPLRVAVQAHAAHEPELLCTALGMLQVQSNGDVTTCPSQTAVGNIKNAPIREIWKGRPRWWETGCCLERRLAANPRGCDGT